VATWASWIGVTAAELDDALHRAIERGDDHRTALSDLRPGFDFERERAAKEAAGAAWTFDASDVYPDAIPCLTALRERGLRLGVAANQPSSIAGILPALGLAVDFVAMSDDWGVAKPDVRFFERVIDAAGVAPERIAYVGDRLDNDVRPARQLGLRAVFVRRGPWGIAHADAARHEADAVIDGLAELPAVLDGLVGRDPTDPSLHGATGGAPLP
jgi:HAD superfamily hydrolase (TIGR01549 family)